MFQTSPQVPFVHHLAKIQLSSTTQTENKLKPDEPAKPPFAYKLNLVIKDFGSSGAASAITGNIEEMQVPVFPFLKQGGQSN